VVDNGSNDSTLSVATGIPTDFGSPVTVVQNLMNLNLGGSHKVAFQYAIDHGFDLVVVLHGDDQADVQDVLPVLETITKDSEIDCWLGSRFMRDSKRTGYAALRTIGNIVFNALFSFVTRAWISDLGSGLNVFRVRALQKAQWLGFRNNLTFNYFMTLAYAKWRWNCIFFPISWRETDQVSNVRAFRQMREMVTMLFKYVFDEGWIFEKNHTGFEGDVYGANVVFRHPAP